MGMVFEKPHEEGELWAKEIVNFQTQGTLLGEGGEWELVKES